MSKFYGKDESIECDGADVVSKKIECSTPLNHPTLGKCLKYACTRDGFAKITMELNPKETKIPYSNTRKDLGDMLEANAFYVLVKGFKPKKISFVGHFSGSHNANSFATASEYTYAEISKPYPVGASVVVKLEPNFESPFLSLAKKQIKDI